MPAVTKVSHSFYDDGLFAWNDAEYNPRPLTFAARNGRSAGLHPPHCLYQHDHQRSPRRFLCQFCNYLVVIMGASLDRRSPNGEGAQDLV